MLKAEIGVSGTYREIKRCGRMAI